MPETPPTIDPGAAALLVMDYQNGIVARVRDPDALLERVSAATETARGHDVVVAYVRVAFTDADYVAVPETNKSFSALTSERLMHDDAPETQIHERVAPRAGDIVVRKVRVGAFSTTDLDAQLRARGITTLIIAGISTSGVVLSTIRDAADRDYRIYVLADATADPDHDVHATLIEKVFPRQAFVIGVADLDDLFGAAPE